ncbi:sulfite exporter TauE/SafE family protein [Thalassococcus sp. CAU 1522]|uniref:Probable membrane transporter protein n=1 Tax=Thalassococcus arenae TaxID=2851652 RepID=A0ABS6N4B2_9RHOB|nr:sulfite exporter TauE/SafE family protein [Thalassococcus arenae]MBV2358855.1 sulfite exporter TauE/SafE family protein [Thalassococcus arenae]
MTGLPPDLAEFALLTLIVAIGSAGQAVIGMGLNLFAIPLLVLLDPIYAPGPILTASLVLCLLALRRVPARIDAAELRPAALGLCAGTVLAALVAMLVDAPTLARLLGAMVVLGVALALSGLSAPLTRTTLMAAGGGAGFLGTIAGVHAPPMALLYQGLAPDRVRGAMLTLIATGSVLSIAALAMIGRFGMAQIVAALAMLPGVLAGLWAAPVLARLIDARLLRFLILAISAISGARLALG